MSEKKLLLDGYVFELMQYGETVEIVSDLHVQISKKSAKTLVAALQGMIGEVEINWNEPTNKPSHGERVVVLSNRGKSATIGVFDSDAEPDAPTSDGKGHYASVVCDKTSYDIWWKHVTAWAYAPGEAVAVSLEQRINAIIESHQKEKAAITHGIASSQAFDVDYLRGREFAEMGIIRDLKKAVKAAGE